MHNSPTEIGELSTQDYGVIHRFGEVIHKTRESCGCGVDGIRAAGKQRARGRGRRAAARAVPGPARPHRGWGGGPTDGAGRQWVGGGRALAVRRRPDKNDLWGGRTVPAGSGGLFPVPRRPDPARPPGARVRGTRTGARSRRISQPPWTAASLCGRMPRLPRARRGPGGERAGEDQGGRRAPAAIPGPGRRCTGASPPSQTTRAV